MYLPCSLQILLGRTKMAQPGRRADMASPGLLADMASPGRRAEMSSLTVGHRVQSCSLVLYSSFPQLIQIN